MNENYLWDKTGEDAELENLENALRQFRYQATAPPALPANILEFKPRRSRRFLRFAFACAASLLIVFIAAVFWSKIFRNDLHGTISAVKTDNDQIAIPFGEITKESRSQNPPLVAAAKPVNNQKPFAPQSIVYPAKTRVTKSVRAFFVKNSQKSRQFEQPAENAVLSKEERFAYDQLMLALSITSEKLKIVKDKAENSGLPDNISSDRK